MFNVNALLIISKLNVLNHCSIRHFSPQNMGFSRPCSDPMVVLLQRFSMALEFQNFQNNRFSRSFLLYSVDPHSWPRQALPWSDNLTHVPNLLLYFILNFSADLDTSTKLHCSQYTGRILLGNHDLACRIY